MNNNTRNIMERKSVVYLPLPGKDEPDPFDNYKGAGWYWWDECWQYGGGPYKTRKEASAEQSKYAKTL